MPRRTCTFLKASSAICGFGSAPAWPRAPPVPIKHTTSVASAQRIAPPDPNFMSPPCLAMLSEPKSFRGRNHPDARALCSLLPPGALLANFSAAPADTIHLAALHTQCAARKQNEHCSSVVVGCLAKIAEKLR